MTKLIAVTIEHTRKKTFATAADWPGWSRSGKTEDVALGTLAAYASRYAAVATTGGRPFSGHATVDGFAIVERLAGSAGTEYGVPSRPTEHDARPTDAHEAAGLARLVEAVWALFDRTAVAAPEGLRKGPRGGGRTTSRIVAHVMDADRAYANEMGIKVRELAVDDRAAVEAVRASMLDVLRAARDGLPLAERRWPARYAAHRIAWHVLDHAWEIEDRTE